MQRVIAGARGAACGDCLRVRAEREANNNNASSGLVSVRERDALIIEALRQEIEQQLTHQRLQNANAEADRANGNFVSIMEEDVVAEVGSVARETIRKRVRGVYYNAGEMMVEGGRKLIILDSSAAAGAFELELMDLAHFSSSSV